MNIGLLEKIDKILKYHSGEFRALSEPSRRDIILIQLLVSIEISKERTRIAMAATDPLSDKEAVAISKKRRAAARKKKK